MTDSGVSPVTKQMVKIVFELDSSEWPGGGTETLWAVPIEEHEPRAFILDNSPFYFRGASYCDVVTATPTKNAAPGWFDFKDVIERGGHSTYMILVSPEAPRRTALCNELKAIGCTYERADLTFKSTGMQFLYSVDVPPSTNLDEAFEILERGENEGVWMFQEGYVPPIGWSAGKQ